MYLSDLQNKDIVSVKDGKKLGHIIDAEINNNGEIVYLIIEPKKTMRKFMSSISESKVPFSEITKIGEDVILVNMWYNQKRGDKCE